eukprot:gene670-744_t
MYLLPATYLGCQGKGAGATLVNLRFEQPDRSDDVLPGSRVLVNPQEISAEIVDIIESAISGGDVSAPCTGAVYDSTAGIRAVLRPILGLWASAEGARWSVGLSDIALALLEVILQFMESTDTNDIFELNLLVSRTRGACLRLLSNDIRMKPDKLSLGLSLLRVLVRCATGLGHGIWLGEALRLLSLISLMIRQQMKLVLGAKESAHHASDLCRTCEALVRSTGGRSVREVGVSCCSVAAWILEGTGETPFDEFELLNESILGLATSLWANQPRRTIGVSAKLPSSAAAEAAEGRVFDNWEIIAIKLALKKVLSGISDVVMAGAKAIDELVRGRGKPEYIQQTLVTVGVERGGEDDTALLSAVLAPARSPQRRLVAAKLLDALYGSVGFGASRVEVGEVKSAGGGNEGEGEELKDEDVVSQVLGPLLYSWLKSRGQGGKEEGSSICESDGGSEGSDVETGDVEVVVEEEEDAVLNDPRGTEEDPLDTVLPLLLCIQLLSSSGRGNRALRCSCYEWLKASGCLQSILDTLIHFHPSLLFPRSLDLTDTLLNFPLMPSGAHVKELVAYALLRTTCEFPSLVRSWWSDLPRRPKNAFRKFVEEKVSGSLVQREAQAAAEAAQTGRWSAEELTVRASAVMREVCATYVHDEARLEVTVRLPPAYPLMNADVDCSSKIGIAEGRWSKWKMQMIHSLSMQHGSVVDVIALWKRNVDKELEGVEPCPICFSILHPKLMSLPSLTCKTSDGIGSSIRKALNLSAPVSEGITTTRGSFTVSDENYHGLRVLAGHNDTVAVTVTAPGARSERRLVLCTFMGQNRVCWSAVEPSHLVTHEKISDRISHFPTAFIPELFRLSSTESSHVTESLSYIRLPDSPWAGILARFGHDEVISKLEEERISGVVPEDESGFGGGRRIGFIGDAAHAMPPNAGQGASMAFEDVVQLCRNMKKMLKLRHFQKPHLQDVMDQVGKNEEGLLHAPSDLPGYTFLDDENAVDRFIKDFERQRMRRVRVIHEDQTGSAMTTKWWTPAFQKWVFDGI